MACRIINDPCMACMAQGAGPSRCYTYPHASALVNSMRSDVKHRLSSFGTLCAWRGVEATGVGPPPESRPPNTHTCIYTHALSLLV